MEFEGAATRVGSWTVIVPRLVKVLGTCADVVFSHTLLPWVEYLDSIGAELPRLVVTASQKNAIGLWDVRMPGKVVLEYWGMRDRQQTSMYGARWMELVTTFCLL